MNPSFEIASQPIGDGRCFIIAEVAQAHDGSLGAAHAFVDVAARAGADAIKFQTHLAAHESTLREPWRVRFSRQDDTRYDYWKRMEFTEPQWVGLATHAREVGLAFLSSPFSFEAVDLLERVGVPAWKVASGEITNLPLIDRIAKTGRPVLLSSGMSSFAELDATVARVREHACPLAVMQCTTAYPTPPEAVGLNVLAELRDRYDCPVGLSDHSATVFAGLAAITLGASLVEVHVALSRDAFGPDTSSSLVPSELETLVRGARFIETALAHPIDKTKVPDSVSALKGVFGKSVVAARPLESGAKLTEADLALKKPGDGLPPARYTSLLGRTLARSLAPDEPIREEDLV